MQCPVCPDTALSMTSREGIEIDYCPRCRGVWLDRGELDKIIERTADLPGAASVTAASGPSAPPYQPAQPYQSPPPGMRHPADDYRHHSDDDYRKYGKYGKHGKRKGLLGELFDFD